ncbi:MAG: hypothetical protein HC810_06620 [Acaryochloridaceae cyanobacterium RL_2_7]|nr:hypothetical protein [Acaryochloridaceae cyanobacterium RL_2_7]
MFEGFNAKLVSCQSNQYQYFYGYLHPILNQLAKRRIITYIEETRSLTPEILTHRGFCSKLKLAKISYFQNEAWIDPAVTETLTLKSKFLEPAQEFLTSKVQGKTPIFVHVRRGDYRFWPRRDIPAILPLSYYQRCIHRMRQKVAHPFFVFTSDEPDYVAQNFGHLESFCIASGSAAEDFALLSLCHGGILSASTFSWWAAYLAMKRDASYPF